MHILINVNDDKFILKFDEETSLYLKRAERIIDDIGDPNPKYDFFWTPVESRAQVISYNDYELMIQETRFIGQHTISM